MAKGLANAISEVRKQAQLNAAKCCVIWTALALREEGFGAVRIKRVLENLHKYATTVTAGTTIDEQVKHIENVTGLKIHWSGNDMTIDGLEEWDDYDA